MFSSSEDAAPSESNRGPMISGKPQPSGLKPAAHAQQFQAQRTENGGDAIERCLDASLRAVDRHLRAQHSCRLLPMPATGSCLFAATAAQTYGDPSQDMRVRDLVRTHMSAPVNRAFFANVVALELNDNDFDGYLRGMGAPGRWGGYPELLAIEEIYDRPVQIYNIPDVVIPQSQTQSQSTSRSAAAGQGQPQQPSSAYSSSSSCAAVDIQPQPIHFKGELPDDRLAHVPPLRFAYRDGVHYDAVMPTSDVTVLSEYPSAEAVCADDSWDEGDDGEGGVYVTPVLRSSSGSSAGTTSSAPMRISIVLYELPPVARFGQGPSSSQEDLPALQDADADADDVDMAAASPAASSPAGGRRMVASPFPTFSYQQNPQAVPILRSPSMAPASTGKQTPNPFLSPLALPAAAVASPSPLAGPRPAPRTSRTSTSSSAAAAPTASASSSSFPVPQMQPRQKQPQHLIQISLTQDEPCHAHQSSQHAIASTDALPGGPCRWVRIALRVPRELHTSNVIWRARLARTLSG